MADEYYYSGSGFYQEDDGDITTAYTDITPLPSPSPILRFYKALRFGQWWILRTLTPQAWQDSERVAAFNRYYLQALSLHHYGIVRTVAKQWVPDVKAECIVQEKIEGSTLDRFMATSPSPEAKMEVFSQIVDALQYCHGKGVAHGRLTPLCVMVTGNGQACKLIDFAFDHPPQADITALGELIDFMQLKSLSALATRCRRGQVTSINQVTASLAGKRRRWWPAITAALALLAFAAGAFVLGHLRGVRQAEQALDTAPSLPSIYYNDTLSLNSSGLDVSDYFIPSPRAKVTFLPWTTPPPGPIPEDVAIDMGTDVLWAPFNVGCTDNNANMLGGYYVWCDTLGAGAMRPSEEWWPASRRATDIAGTDLDYVRRCWGGRWRMPNTHDFEQLHLSCLFELVKRDGIPMGYAVHAPNGNSIFLPLAGWRRYHEENSIGVVGHYWSSTPAGANHPRRALSLRLDTLGIVDSFDTISIGMAMSIRPVLER